MVASVPTQKTRLEYIDMAKGIGIMLIVIGHNYTNEWIHDWIFSFHVPLFFFISGLFYKDRAWNEELNSGWRLLLRPFYITGLIIFLLSLLFPELLQIKASDSWFWWIKEHHIASFLLGCSHWGHYEVTGSWFLIALFWSKLAMKSTSSLSAPIRLFIFLCLFIFAEYLASNGLYWEIPFYMVPSLASPIFFYLGSLIKKSSLMKAMVDFRTLPLLLVVAGCAYLVPVNTRIAGYPLFIFNIASSLLISMAIIGTLKYICGLKCCHCLNSFLAYCGRYSLVILCFHGIESSMCLSDYLTFLPESMVGVSKYLVLSIVPVIVGHVPYLREVYNIKK